jgi:hypothetical protein
MPSIDDFFANLDDTERAKRDEQAENQDELTAHRNKIHAVIANEINPLVEQYAARLKQRGLRVRLSTSQSGFELSLWYNSPAKETTLSLGFDHSKKRFVLDHNRGEVHRSGAQSQLGLFDEHWTLSEFEGFVQRFINDAFFYADRYGGLQQEVKGKV